MRPPNRTWQALGLIGVIALAIAVCLTVPGPGKRPENLFKKPKKSPEEIAQIQKKAPDLPFKLTEGKAQFGNPEAAVKVAVFIPGGDVCGNESAIFVQRVAEANKDKLFAEVVDFHDEGGARYQQELGATCSGLMVNGKQLIETVDEAGTKKTLDFGTNLGGSYGEEDLLLALDLEFEKAYGKKCKRPAPAPTETPEAGGQDTAKSDATEAGHASE